MQRFKPSLVFLLLAGLCGCAGTSSSPETSRLPVQLNGQLIDIPVDSESRLILNDQLLLARNKNHYLSLVVERLAPEQISLKATDFVTALLSDEKPETSELQAARTLMERQIVAKEALELNCGVAYYTRSQDGTERITYAFASEPSQYYVIESRGQDPKVVFNSLKLKDR